MPGAFPAAGDSHAWQKESMDAMEPSGRAAGRHDGEEAAPNLAGVSLRVFEIFVAVAEQGGMTAAAARLGISQPAISQAIRTLENVLGQKLFDRSIRPAVLTLAGTSVLHHASAILKEMGALELAVRPAGDARLPMLRIGMANSFAVTVGPRLVDRLAHVAARWLVSSGPSETRIDGLLERRVDLVISFDEIRIQGDFVVTKLFSEPYFLAMPAGFKGDASSLGRLAGQLDMLRYGKHLHLSRQIESYLDHERVACPLRYRFDNIDAVIAMVAAGLGWALVTPLCLLKSANLAPRLKCVPLPGRPLRRELVLVARKEEGRVIAPLIRDASIELLREAILPELRRLVPAVAGQIRLAGAAQTVRSAARKRKNAS